MRGGARTGAGAPKKPDHLKKVWKQIGMYPINYNILLDLKEETELSLPDLMVHLTFFVERRKKTFLTYLEKVS